MYTTDLPPFLRCTQPTSHLFSDVHNRPPIFSQMYTTDLPPFLRCTQPTSHLFSDVHNRPPILSQMYTTDLPSYLRCTQPTSHLFVQCLPEIFAFQWVGICTFKKKQFLRGICVQLIFQNFDLYKKSLKTEILLY